MPDNSFNLIRNIDNNGIETWLYSDIANFMTEVSNLREYSVASQLEMLDDGIDLKLHIWSSGDDDYVLDRTACGYLLASCPGYYDSVAIGQEYFNCSQIRRARAIVTQIEIDAEARVI